MKIPCEDLKYLILLPGVADPAFHFDADPVPTFHSDADPDPTRYLSI